MKYLIYIAMILVCPVHLVAELPEIPVSKAGKKTIQIKAGRNQGVKKGMKLDVFRQEERVLHPITGEVLGSPKVKIAEVKIAKVFWNSSQGKITLSYAPILAGDVVRESGSVPMEPVDAPASMGSSKAMPRGSDYINEIAERLTSEIAGVKKKINSLTKTLRRIGKIERGIARMRGEIGAMQSNISNLKQEVEILKETSGSKEAVTINRDNLEEFMIKFDDLNIPVKSGPEPFLLPFESFAQILLPYVRKGQHASVDSLVSAKFAEMSTSKTLTMGMKSEEGHVSSEADGHGKDPMDELQGLINGEAPKSTWKDYLFSYWWVLAGGGVFLFLLIIVMKIMRKKAPAEDEEGFLALDQEEDIPMPEPVPEVATTEGEEQS